MRAKASAVALQAMSTRQQQIVESHLPLVHLTLQRCSELVNLRRPGREPRELLQEGCLALAEAVRTHDPTRHGPFATFAMARIHYAMSRFAHEQHSTIRIPFITQRRWKRQRAGENGDRHRPEPLPRVVCMNDRRKTPSQNLACRRYAERMAARREGITIGDLLRECYDRATARVVAHMKQAPRRSAGLHELLERCHRERWTVPEPDARMPIRRLADKLGCSIGRITRCEERFRRQVAAVIQADPAYGELLRLGRRRAEGWRYRLSPEEIAVLKRLQTRPASRDVPSHEDARPRPPQTAATTRAFPRRSVPAPPPAS